MKWPHGTFRRAGAKTGARAGAHGGERARAKGKAGHFLAVFIGGCLAWLLAFSGAVQAQGYPQHTVTLIVPFSAGGATDLSARLIAQLLTKQLGQSFVVENRVGAAGMIGMSQVARAAPDGYTLGWGGNSPMTISPYVTKNPQYDPAKAFAPISIAGISSFVLVTRADLPVATFADFVALAKSRPGQMTYASTGVGSSVHLLGELMKNSAKVDLLHVPYKGESDSVAALLAGQVDCTWLSAQVATPQVLSGRLKGLLSTAPLREKALPAVPTATEAGVPDLTVEIFFGLVAPAKTPAPIIAKLAAAMKTAAADPAYIAAMDKVGMLAKSDDPDDFTAMLARHSSRWQDVIKRTGISTD